jgi:hypothetical protein
MTSMPQSGDGIVSPQLPTLIGAGSASLPQHEHFAMGPERERIWARLREINTRLVRLFSFGKGAPDHLRSGRGLRAGRSQRRR